jgi:hypothetical protein
VIQFGGAGWSSPVARQAHNLKVVGSNPTPATNKRPALCGLFCWFWWIVDVHLVQPEPRSGGDQLAKPVNPTPATRYRPGPVPGFLFGVTTGFAPLTKRSNQVSAKFDAAIEIKIPRPDKQSCYVRIPLVPAPHMMRGLAFRGHRHQTPQPRVEHGMSRPALL